MSRSQLASLCHSSLHGPSFLSLPSFVLGSDHQGLPAGTGLGKSEGKDGLHGACLNHSCIQETPWDACSVSVPCWALGLQAHPSRLPPQEAVLAVPDAVCPLVRDSTVQLPPSAAQWFPASWPHLPSLKADCAPAVGISRVQGSAPGGSSF